MNRILQSVGSAEVRTPQSTLDRAAQQFRASMSATYRTRFSLEAIAHHARIAAARGQKPVHVELVQPLADGAVVCVVADDRAGLLCHISLALVAHDLDVTRAHVHCRRRYDGRTEAFDLFAVRRLGPWPTGRAPTGELESAPLGGPLSADEIGAFAETLDALLAGRKDALAVGASTATVTLTDPLAEAPRVTFVVDSETGAALLAIEATDRPGLLLGITRALFEVDVQIVRAEVATVGARALDTFYVLELDGGPISATRRNQIEAAAALALRRLA